MEVKSKVWIEEGGELIFGSGRAAILSAVKKNGSLNKAAEKLGVSYRKIWSQIHSVEERLGKALLKKNTGGKGGGGAQLTEFAEDLLQRFLKLELYEKEFTDKIYKTYFKGIKK